MISADGRIMMGALYALYVISSSRATMMLGRSLRPHQAMIIFLILVLVFTSGHLMSQRQDGTGLIQMVHSQRLLERMAGPSMNEITSTTRFPSGETTFPPRMYSYNTYEYDFRGRVCDIFWGKRLEFLNDSAVPILKKGGDQDTDFHTRFYDYFPEEVQPLYLRFIHEVIAPCFREKIIFQAVPTFRVHLPGNVAVGEFHTDGDYNHQEGEVNFWLPLTHAFTTNSIMIETRPGSRIWDVISARYGDLLVFDSVRYQHGNVQNQTGRTRVSFDFRCIPVSQYRPTGARTVNTGALLEVGDYFRELDR